MVVKRRLLLLMGAAVLVLAAASPALGYLSDMSGHWAAPLVAAMEARGIVSGDDFGRFQPEAPLTRAQLAKLMVTSLGYQDEAQLLAGHPSRFIDVPRWHWARGYVEVLAETGTVEGYPDGGYQPEATVSRAQLAAVLVRAAGFAEQARLRNFEASGYRDDASIPDWARGVVNVARATGLMAGFEDGTFRPLQPVTRAEGSVALFRFLAARGNMFHLTGTLLRFDPVTRTGVMRDELGAERSITMDPTAGYYRAGQSVPISQISPLDQVWIVANAEGAGLFLEARYADLLGTNVQAAGLTLSLTDQRGTQRQVVIQAGALVYLNGARAKAEDLSGAAKAYVVLNRLTGEARLVDAVKPSLQGELVGVDEVAGRAYVRVGSDLKDYAISRTAVLERIGKPVPPGELVPGARVQLALNPEGVIVYLQAER